ncbi:MAG: DegV family protein [Lachnospiraceae bacterium]|nr:DegV family protein [Lachnospiraceae bacterium]
MNYQIFSDGACDLLKEYTEPNNVHVVPFYVSFDGDNYVKEGIGISHDEFYRRMAEDHEVPKSSLPSTIDYVEAFMPYIKQGDAIICMTITEKFSGSYNSACLAKEQVLEDYPDAKISIIDSTLNTMSQALLVYTAVELKKQGKTYEECVDLIENVKTTGQIFFTVGSLEYLIKNGRIGKLATVAGDKLGIQPIIIMKDGDICFGGAARSRKKAKAMTVSQLQKFFNKNEIDPKDYLFLIGTGFQLEEAAEWQKEIEETLGIKAENIPSRIGTAIGCHTGPFPMGCAILKKII